MEKNFHASGSQIPLNGTQNRSDVCLQQSVCLISLLLYSVVRILTAELEC